MTHQIFCPYFDAQTHHHADLSKHLMIINQNCLFPSVPHRQPSNAPDFVRRYPLPFLKCQYALVKEDYNCPERMASVAARVVSSFSFNMYDSTSLLT